MYRQSSLQCQLNARDALEMTAVWLLLVTRYQRWSRGHKARGQGQGQGLKKSEAKDKDSLSEDRPSRGQGQECSRPRTKDTAASILKKNGLQKRFLGDLQFIGVARIFDWGRPKSQITCNDVIKIFQTRSFCETKISKGGRSEIVACRQVTGLCKERGIKLILEKRKYLTLKTY